MKKILFSLVLFALCMSLIPMAGAQAQATTATVSFTEAELNAAYRVVNPRRQKISNVFVDIQEGQVVVTSTVTPETGNRSPVRLAVTYVPKLVQTSLRTRLEWDVTQVTVDGTPTSGSTYASIRNAYSTALRNALDSKFGRSFSVTSFTVGGDVITVNGSR
jgi:hypothetical protein